MTETLSPAATARRAITPDDLLAIATITGAQIAPDGRFVAYAVQRNDLERNRKPAAIWIASTDGSAAHPITSGEHADGSPRWSPDGRRLAFVSDRSGKPQIYVIDRAESGWGGEPRQLTRLGRGVSNPVWSPDGRRLAFLSTEGNGMDDRERDEPGGPIRHVRRKRYRFDIAGYIDDRFTHIWVVDLPTEAGGRIPEPRQVTRGDYDDVMPAWSPDGKRLAFTSNRQDEQNTMFRSQLYVVDVPPPTPTPTATPATAPLSPGLQAERPGPATTASLSPTTGGGGRAGHPQGSGALPTSLSPSIGGEGRGEGDPPADAARRVEVTTEIALAPAWSPDGQRLAFISRRPDAPPGANNAVYAVAPDGGGLQELTAGFDRSPGVTTYSDTWSTMAAPPTLFWAPAGDAVYFTAADCGRVPLFRADAGGSGGVRPVVGGERTLAFGSIAREGGRLAYAAGSFTNPCDLYTCDADGGNEQRLTEINRALLAELPIQAPEHLPFASYDGGFSVDAWLYRPVGYGPGQRYPLIQVIHGGPHSTFGYTFFFDMQLFASAGYNVLFVNPRATGGYGEAFATCNLGRWGEGDAPEQLAALDLAIERGGVDPDRLGVTGLSYGGYMTNWLIGTTNRYRAAVSENSVANLVSFYGTSDIGWYWIEGEIAPDIWSNLDTFYRLSPITYAGRVTTPTLFLQAEADWRCPTEQGEQMYAALRARGVDAEMVRFPGEAHGFLSGGKPRSRLERRRHMLRWFDRYLRGQ